MLKDKFGTLSVVIDAFRLLKISVDRLQNLRFSCRKDQFNEPYALGWINPFEQEIYRNELMIATKLNPLEK